jgi:ABC-type uncharacterized transport system permease subunit
MALANSLAFLLYLACTATLIRQFVQNNNTVGKTLPIGVLTILAILFHSAGIFFTMRDAGGWDVSLITTISIISWLMAVVTFVFGAKFTKAHPGIVVYPIVALSIILNVEAPKHVPQGISNPALEWHILLSLAAYSLFSLAAIQSLVLAIQEKQLRNKNNSRLVRSLPALQTMETTLFQLLSTGFILLTIGLATGFIFLEDMMAQQVAHKTVLSLIGWLVFAILLWGRWRFGWRGKTAIKWTLVGFLFLALAYIGTKFVLEFLL